MIIELDLNNYPGILKALEDDPKREQKALSDHLTLLSDIYEKNYNNVTREAFKMDYLPFMKLLSDTFLDYKGIAKQHPIAAEAEAMEILEFENNPISIFTSGASAYDINGNQLSKSDFLGHPVKLKDYLQGLLYAAKYIPHKEYVKYLTLNEFDLVDGLKHANVEKLINIQPALQYQKLNNLPIGKLLPGTSFFDCGPLPEDQKLITNPLETDTHIYCLDTKAVFSKQ